MSIEEIILNRRTVHSYKKEKIPDDVVRRAVELGILAPNHRHTWPWRFFSIGESARRKLAARQIEMKQKKSQTTLNEEEQKSILEKFMEPAALLIVGIKKSGDATREREDFAALACALQNVSLYLWSKDYGCKWSTGGLIQDPATYDLLGQSAQNFEICGLFWIGRPKVIPQVIKRPPLDEIFKVIE